MHTKRKYLSNKQRLAIVIRFNGRCFYCGFQFDLNRLINPQGYLWIYKRGKTPFHIDHKTPLAHGGANEKENLVLACAKCNLKKSKKLICENV